MSLNSTDVAIIAARALPEDQEELREEQEMGDILDDGDLGEGGKYILSQKFGFCKLRKLTRLQPPVMTSVTMGPSEWWTS